MTSSARPLTNPIDLQNLNTKPRSLWSDALRRLRRNRAAMVGLLVIVLYVIVAIAAPWLAPYNPVQQIPNNSLRPPAWVTDNPARMGVPEHLLGTDTLGRDVLSRLMYAIRVSLIVGIVPQFAILLIGVTIGLISGFASGWLDNLLMRFTEIVAAFPDLLFIIALSTAFRETWLGRTFNGLLLIFIAVSLVSWTGIARLVRGQVLSLKEKEFVEAARTIGVPTLAILWRHILPNTLAPIIVSTSFSIPALISAEAVLTILGVGMRPSLDPDNPFPTSLGVMLTEGYNNLSSGPWLLSFPVILIAGLMLSFTFLGDGLRDALDPRER